MRLVTLDDAPVIQGWFERHGDRVPRLPPTGLIEDGVAAGFLAKTDSGVAFLEAYVTNPEAPSADRDLAIDRITRELSRMAKADGFDSLLILTIDQGLVARAAQRHGFTYVGLKHGLLKDF